jgi:hypothetical protein
MGSCHPSLPKSTMETATCPDGKVLSIEPTPNFFKNN